MKNETPKMQEMFEHLEALDSHLIIEGLSLTEKDKEFIKDTIRKKVKDYETKRIK